MIEDDCGDCVGESGDCVDCECAECDCTDCDCGDCCGDEGCCDCCQGCSDCCGDSCFSNEGCRWYACIFPCFDGYAEQHVYDCTCCTFGKTKKKAGEETIGELKETEEQLKTIDQQPSPLIEKTGNVIQLDSITQQPKILQTVPTYLEYRSS